MPTPNPNERLLLRLDDDPVHGPETSAPTGFYDQSHLVNEFRALCGLTPTEFLARSASGSSKTDA